MTKLRVAVAAGIVGAAVGAAALGVSLSGGPGGPDRVHVLAQAAAASGSTSTVASTTTLPPPTTIEPPVASSPTTVAKTEGATLMPSSTEPTTTTVTQGVAPGPVGPATSPPRGCPADTTAWSTQPPPGRQTPQGPAGTWCYANGTWGYYLSDGTKAG